ncbi:MAG: TonB-dependent receptor [Williamsia sp.]|nr:TonB-dependent receptor [Williamsia sp.]
MRIIATLFIFLLISLSSFAQTSGTVQGTLFDSSVNKGVANVTVTVMKQRDSSLVSFTMTDGAGKFSLSGLAAGSYRLLFTHVNYHNKSVSFAVSSQQPSLLLGNIILYDKSKLLEEVVVRPEDPPVTLLGDTIQYNAGSFKTLPNANVEDLLEKLPGVRVDKDGTVKAQGEKVQKVLVDGKEFFGNDPKIATRNLPADAIDKVQVYDRLSDQAQLTGFDDGNSQKTINLTLKKDKKKGAFGKLTAGAGTDERYQARFNINQFKGARQLSAIGMANNTNAEGFSFMDVLNFTGALNQLKNGGNINLSVSPDDPLAGLLGGNNTGINNTGGGGINYNNIIGNKTDFQGSYFYSRFNPVRESLIERQYFSPANFYQQHAITNNLNNTHRLNAAADYQLDSFNAVKITTNLAYQQTSNKSQSDYTTQAADGLPVNSGNSNSLSNKEGTSLSATILYRKRFRQKRRSFSINLLTNLNGSEGNGNLYSMTDFYDKAGASFLRNTVKQTNQSEENLQGLNARAVYTEPLFKRSLLEFSVGRSYTLNRADKTTWDYNQGTGKYDQVNKLLSNNFENGYGNTNAGLRLRKQTSKYNFAWGAAWQQATLTGKIIGQSKDSLIRKNFRNLLPSARFQYYFTRNKNILISYTTNTNQPTISQLQPLPDNSNPLYVREGNPDLKQEFTHVLRISTSVVDVFKNKNFFAFFTLQQTQNKIVNFDRINQLGVDSVRPVNINGVFSFNGNLSYGMPVRFLKGMLDISSDLYHYRGKQFVNGQANLINTFTAGPQLRLSMNPADKLTFSLTGSSQLSHTRYSLPSAQPAKWFIQDYSADGGWQLPHGILLATDFNYRITHQYGRDGVITRVPLWNAAISKQMLAFHRGELKLSVNDLLNRNLAVNRNANQNYIEDTRTNNLRRFFLLSFTYNLTKTGLNNGVRVMR